MKQQLEKVKLFHEKFGIENGETPRLLSYDEYMLRHKLMDEECLEYLEACEQEDIVEVADALGDQLYILLGTMLRHGLQDKIEQIFDEIQDSNMSKLGEDGNPIYRSDGKILKGPNFFTPDIKKIIHG